MKFFFHYSTLTKRELPTMNIYELLKQRYNCTTSIKNEQRNIVSINTSVPYLICLVIFNVLSFFCFIKNFDATWFVVFFISLFLTYVFFKKYKKEAKLLEKYGIFLEKIEDEIHNSKSNNLSYLYNLVVIAHNKNIKSNFVDELNKILSEYEKISDKQLRCAYVKQIDFSKLHNESLSEYKRVSKIALTNCSQ